MFHIDRRPQEQVEALERHRTHLERMPHALRLLDGATKEEGLRAELAVVHVRIDEHRAAVDEEQEERGRLQADGERCGS